MKKVYTSIPNNAKIATTTAVNLADKLKPPLKKIQDDFDKKYQTFKTKHAIHQAGPGEIYPLTVEISTAVHELYEENQVHI